MTIASKKASDAVDVQRMYDMMVKEGDTAGNSRIMIKSWVIFFKFKLQASSTGELIIIQVLSYYNIFLPTPPGVKIRGISKNGQQLLFIFLKGEGDGVPHHEQNE